jgi:hypothetical protein
MEGRAQTARHQLEGPQTSRSRRQLSFLDKERFTEGSSVNGADAPEHGYPRIWSRILHSPVSRFSVRATQPGCMIGAFGQFEKGLGR